MTTSIKALVIVGGGSAGWLTAGVVAAELRRRGSPVSVTLVESPTRPPIGVGEGTWPTMRRSLSRMGISETVFLRDCDASFKQGTAFIDWQRGGGERYYHPFSPPRGFPEFNLASHWQAHRGEIAFAAAVSAQGMLCDRHVAPKQIVTPEYAGNVNYGYHLDAGKFADLLCRHCTQTLGVRHLMEDVTAINRDDAGYLTSLRTASGAEIPGDLFVDCTGMRALLIGETLGVGFRDVSGVLFNDRALAVQLPRSDAAEAIASATRSSARAAGWIWDIALPSRRGIGYTYSSAHSSDAEAEATLREYLSNTAGPERAASLEPRRIAFRPGYREQFWHRNCVAIGLSAGFVEPLEASALVMIELSAKMLGELMPPDRAVMDIVAKRFNRKFRDHWERILEFLKLHYVLSERDDADYWQDHRDPNSVPETLRDSLTLWQHHCPWHGDQGQADELFSTASYQYVLYGMGFRSAGSTAQQRAADAEQQRAGSLFAENQREIQRLLAALPTNRVLIDKIHEHGLSRV